MRLWLVRHAPPVVAPGTCYGRLDVPADPAATQAAALALHAALPHALQVLCSPALRCRQLRDELLALRPHLAVREEPRLHEMDFGRWEGQPWDAIGRAAMDAWMADFAHHAPGGGESAQQVLDRVRACRDDAAAQATDMLWITHAGVIRALRLLQSGVERLAHAGQWPEGAVPFGGWELLALGPLSAAAPAARA
jgi:alpha-ribazole phosphatase